MDVLKGEEGKRVASGARHFRPTSGERLCGCRMDGFFDRNIIIFRDPNFFASPLCNEKPSPLGRAANFLSGIRV